MEITMTKIVTINGATEFRKLDPFAYKDTIKSLDKSNEARVTIDGERVFRSAVTSGKDGKSGTGAMKYHLYFYATEAAAVKRDTGQRSWMPITAEEFRAYKHDPGYVIAIATVAKSVAKPVAKPVAEPEAPTKTKGRQAKRVTA